MKKQLAITFALILCFASMTFAQTSRQSKPQGRSESASGIGISGIKNTPPALPVPLQRGTEEINQNDISFHVDFILDPLDLLLTFIL